MQNEILNARVRLRLLARAVLILSAVSTSAVRLHAHVDTVYATQELNRCLRVVAASRKQAFKASRYETPNLKRITSPRY